MGFISILLTGFGLAMDAFAVSVTKGMTLKKINFPISFKIAFSFGFFQGIMPFIGWFLGIRFESYIKSVDHWIAVFLLSFIGLKMIFEAFESKNDYKNNKENLEVSNDVGIKELLVLSVATSIDALAVGISFAFLNVSILPVCLSIGIITFVTCLFGVLIGKGLGSLFKDYAQILGGIVLVFIGFSILNEHTNFIYNIFH